MLTTKEVRAIMRKHKKNYFGSIYTNKTPGDQSNVRRVKCYFNTRESALLYELMKKAGSENVKVTDPGMYYATRPGLIVKCVLG